MRPTPITAARNTPLIAYSLPRGRAQSPCAASPLVDPACREEYLEGLAESVAVAQRLNCPTLISQVGDACPDLSREAQHASLVAGLREAASILQNSGVVLGIEPLNETVDHQGYYLVRSDEAFAIIEEVARTRSSSCGSRMKRLPLYGNVWPASVPV